VRNSIRYSVNGRIENWHETKTLSVVCPLVRDVVESSMDWLRVYYFDGYPGTGSDNKGLFRCRLRSNYPEGTGEVAEDYDDSEGADGDGDFEMSIDAEVTDGNCTLACVIPPIHAGVKSYLASIRYQEP
jgi:hypothetical protein